MSNLQLYSPLGTNWTLVIVSENLTGMIDNAKVILMTMCEMVVACFITGIINILSDTLYMAIALSLF